MTNNLKLGSGATAYGVQLSDTYSEYKKHGIVNVAAVQTGESAALRIYVPDMNMQKSFDDYVDDQVPKCFKAIEELIALANMAHTISRLDYSNGYNK